MAKQFEQLDDRLIDYIQRQKIFFTASAADGTRINMSPRSTDCLRIVDSNTVIYLDRTGSGNETAAHLKADGRLTIMFCAVEGPPQILRLYGQGEIVHRDSVDYRDLKERWFRDYSPIGARQIVRLNFDLVQTSCGFGVPLFEYQGERDSLDRWAHNKGPDGIVDYWIEKNQASMDGLPTDIMNT